MKQSFMLDRLQPSGIRKMFARAAGLEGVISLGIGAPDIQPPDKLLEIMTDKLHERTHGYVLNDGITELHEKIKLQYREEYGLDTSNSAVIVGSGATQVMYASFFSYLNPGDELLIPDPGFVLYPAIPQLGEINIKGVPVNDEFQMTADAINELISEKSKMIVVNSPGNPTGVVQTKETLKGIADIAIDNNLIILSDEVYEFMIFDGMKHVPMSTLAPENTITLNSFSKTYCVPGWRLGYVMGNKELIAPISKLHSLMVANAPSLPQYAISEFMNTEEDKKFRSYMRDTMEKRRDVVTDAFNSIDGITVPKISGSFYAFPRIEHEKYSGENPGYSFAEDIFENTRVVSVAASEFGSTRKDHFRLSFGSANIETIKEAAQRINDHFNQF